MTDIVEQLLSDEKQYLNILAERENPLPQSDPNRHLWSRGFKTGFYASESLKEFLLIRTVKEEKSLTQQPKSKTTTK